MANMSLISIMAHIHVATLAAAIQGVEAGTSPKNRDMLMQLEDVRTQNEILLRKFADFEEQIILLSENVERLESVNERILDELAVLGEQKRTQERTIQDLRHAMKLNERKIRNLENVCDGLKQSQMADQVYEVRKSDIKPGNVTVSEEITISGDEAPNPHNAQSQAESRNEDSGTWTDANGAMVTRLNESTSRRRMVRDVLSVVQEPVAFFATHTQHDIRNLGHNQAIAFDNVETNLGNAYHPDTGIFSAPYHGLYMFSGTIAALDNNGGWLYIWYSRNGYMVAQTHSKGGDTTSHTVLLVLNPGDMFYLSYIMGDVPGDGILGQHYSSFAGQLITRL